MNLTATCICGRNFTNLGAFEKHLGNCGDYKVGDFSNNENFIKLLSQKKQLSKQAINR